MKQMKVDAIRNGTVIDHIPAGKALKVINILDILGNDVVMIGINLNSNKIEKKDILKIENKDLSSTEVNTIALIAPNATLTNIRDFEVVKKVSLEMPEYIEKHILCPNPNCITNIEQVKSKFKINKKKKTAYCVYCEKKYKIEDLKIRIR